MLWMKYVLDSLKTAFVLSGTLLLNTLNANYLAPYVGKIIEIQIMCVMC